MEWKHPLTACAYSIESLAHILCTLLPAHRSKIYFCKKSPEHRSACIAGIVSVEYPEFHSLQFSSLRPCPPLFAASRASQSMQLLPMSPHRASATSASCFNCSGESAVSHFTVIIQPVDHYADQRIWLLHDCSISRGKDGRDKKQRAIKQGEKRF